VGTNRTTSDARPRLQLRREALRELTVDDLRQVAGGTSGCKPAYQ
jgi:hypothetical protein